MGRPRHHVPEVAAGRPRRPARGSLCGRLGRTRGGPGALPGPPAEGARGSRPLGGPRGGATGSREIVAGACGQHGGLCAAGEAGALTLHVAAGPQGPDPARSQPSASPPARGPALVQPEALAAAAAAGPGGRRGLAGGRLAGVARGGPEAQGRGPQPGRGPDPERPRGPSHPARAPGRSGPRVVAPPAQAGGSRCGVRQRRRGRRRGPGVAGERSPWPSGGSSRRWA